MTNLEPGILKRTTIKLVSTVLKHTKTTMALYILLTIAAIVSVGHLKFDTSVDVFFDMKSEKWLKSDIVEDMFGGGDRAIIALRDENIFTERNLKIIATLTDELEKIEDVNKVISLTTVNDTIGEEDNFIVEPLIEDIPSNTEDLAEIRKRALTNPLYIKNIISEDGKTAAITVEIEKIPNSDGSYKAVVIKKIEKLMEELVPKDLEARLGGDAPLAYYYSVHMQEDLQIFLPLAFLLMTIMLFITYRRFGIVILPLTVVTASLIYTLASMFLCGLKINNVTVIVPPIILAIAIADSMHFLTHAIRAKESNKANLLLNTANHLLIPCFLTTITTIVGFLSLTVSHSPAIKQLGLIAGIGVFIAFLVTFSLLPILIKLKRKNISESKETDEKHDQDNRLDKALTWIGHFNEKHGRLILVAATVVLAISIWGATKIVVESSILQQLNPKMEIYKNTTFIEKNLTGIHFAYITFKHQDAGALKDPNRLKVIEDLQKFLLTIPQVDKTTSITDLIKDMNKSFNNEDETFYKIPDTRQMISQYALLYDVEDLERTMDSQWSWSVLTFRLKEHGSVKLQAIFDQIEEYLPTARVMGMEVELLGPSVNEAEGANTVTQGQIRSLCLAMTVIFVMMFIVFRSISVGFICTVPNLLPLAINFGIMGAFGIPLDTATSLISAIGIGIIVDDTIHYTYGFGAALQANGGDYTKAMYESLQSKGRAIIFTSVILACSFGVLTASQFLPTFQFGLLTSLVMLNALLADLFVLPCLFIWLKPRFAKMES